VTTKQIAAYLGKPERTVQDWVKSLSAKSAPIDAKLASSSPRRPADYDLNETCQIIAEGMGEDVANVYRTNAVNAEIGKDMGSGKLPAGVQLREMRLIYGPEEAGRRLDVILGYKASSKPLAIEAPVSGNLGKLSKAAYAVEMKERAKAEQKETAKRLNGDLFNSK
jgi:hypothetical protein